MRLIYNNIVEDATITSYSENPQYLWEDALLDTRLSRIGRTIGDDEEWIKFIFTGAVPASYIFILNHNITSGATVTLQGNATDVWTSPSLSEILTVDDVCYANFTQASYQYWRLLIDDPSNPDGYIEISKIILGIYLQMPGFSRVFSMPRKSTSNAEKSVSGQLYGDKRIIFNSAEFKFNDILNATKLLIDAFFDEVENIKPFVLLIWENDLDIQLPVYVNITADQLNWAREDSEDVLWSLTIPIEECF